MRIFHGMLLSVEPVPSWLSGGRVMVDLDGLRLRLEDAHAIEFYSTSLSVLYHRLTSDGGEEGLISWNVEGLP